MIATFPNSPPRSTFLIGDLCYALTELRNDGGIPDAEVDALLASPGTRGVIVKVGHLEQDPGQTLYLVRFEGSEKVLGPPIGCLPEELTQDPP
jgi:nitrogen fixation protein NifZ